MKQMYLLLVATILFSSCRTYEFAQSNMRKHALLDVGDAYVMKHPVTNREYLVYLSWLMRVYGESYPEVVIKAFPGLKDREAIAGTGFYVPEDLQVFLDELTDAHVKQYIFNIRYLDYPIIGLSSNQANEYCRWLTDRMNEARLVELSILNFNPEQKDEDNFNTEAYLMGQYQGSVRRNIVEPGTNSERAPRWEDRIFSTGFRLPLQKELATARNLKDFALTNAPYPFRKNHFLWAWHQLYLKVDETTMVLFPDYYDSHKIQDVKGVYTPFDKILLADSLVELTFDESLPTHSKLILDAYLAKGANQVEMKTYEMVEKDSLGRMPFVIIGEDQHRAPLTLTPLVFTDENTIDKTFRCACSKKMKR